MLGFLEKNYDKHDVFTNFLKSKGYDVDEEFYPKTSIPMGYKLPMKAMTYTYQVRTNELLLLLFERLKDGGTGNLLKELFTFFHLASLVDQIQIGKVLVNRFPLTETQKNNQKMMLKFAENFPTRLVQAMPVNILCIDLSQELKLNRPNK